MIIDIHSHMERDYECPETGEAKLLQDMKKNGIGYRVVSTLTARSIREGNAYISDLVCRNPERLLGAAVINPRESTWLEDTRHALALPGIGMLEFQSVEHGYYPDHCPELEEILRMAEEHQVPVKMFTGIGARSMPQQWIGHVKKHKRLPFIFLHMGCFDYGYGCIDLAMEYDNLYLETSNQYEVQILKKAITVLPANKLLFGSSYPERFTKCSVDVFDMFRADPAYLRAVYAENSLQLLKGRLPEEAAAGAGQNGG